MRDCSWIPPQFPNARPDNFKCCSDRTDNLPHNGYNCIAWAAGKTDKWWWPVNVPGAFWPIPIDPIDPVTESAFIEAFKTERYKVCEDASFERGYEKVAIYVDKSGEPTHAARQLPNGAWTSKMGKGEDIEHNTLQIVENVNYGVPKIFLKRPNSLCQKPNQQKTLLLRLLEFFKTPLKKIFPIANNISARARHPGPALVSFSP